MHSVVLDTGKVLFFTNNSSAAQVFNPASGVFTNVPNTHNPNIECAGMAPLPDGRILVVGGLPGNSFADLFDPATQSWVALPNMHNARFYPTVTTLPDGRMLVVGGDNNGTVNTPSTSEIYNQITNSWTLPFASQNVPYYPHMFVLPNGTLVETGASEFPDVTRTLNVATQTWTTIDPNVVDGESSVMYLPGLIMKEGTASDDTGTTTPSAATTYVIDMTKPSPKWVRTGDMNFGRATNTQLVTLPDGNVMVFNGGSTVGGMDLSKGILAAEQWSPITKTWSIMASMVTPRLYHSSAVLLPDGRVFVGGTGDDAGVPDELNYEIYSPPYLFKGARPTITSVSGGAISYGSSFFVETPDGASITSVALMGPGAATHGDDMNQRFVPLSFTQTTGGLTVQAPANANLAPPGHDMLFIVNNRGVPSIAKFVTITQPLTPAITFTANPTSITSGGTSLLTWSSTNSTSCTGTGFSAVVTSGSISVSPTATTTYSLSCTGAGGTASANATVTVGSSSSSTPILINEYETAWDSAATPKTASFSAQAGDVLVASAMTEDAPITAGISGGSLTWTQQQVVNVNGYGWLSIWTATVDINKAMTVTFTRGGSAGVYGGNVFQFRNASGIGASAKANLAGGAPTLNLNTTQSNSAIVVANVDWAALSGASRIWRSNAGSFTERSYAAVSGAYTIYSGYHANAGLIGTYAVGLSAPAGQKYSIAAVEIKGVSGSPVPTVSLSANPISVVSGGSSTLTWASTNATSCTASDGWSGTLATSGSQILTNLTTTATYTLTCTGTGGTASANAAVTVTTPDTSAPTIPSGLSGTAISSSQINLKWTASTDDVGVTGYKIFRNSVQVGTSTTASYSDTGLSPSTTYSYTVSAYDAAVNSSNLSNGFSVATLSINTAPVSIIDFAFTPNSITVPVGTTVAWTNMGTRSHTVTENTGSFDSGTILPEAQSFHQFTVPGTYPYHCSIHTSMVGTVIVTPPLDTTAPSIPTNLSGTTISSSQINLTWTASTDDVGVTGYKIFRNGTQVGASTTTSYSDTGLTANTTYTYAVYAYDAAGNNSTQSSSVSVTTLASSPSPTFINEYETSWNSATTPKTTASFSVQAGDVLVASAMTEDAPITASISGGSLTWTQQQVVNVNGYGWLSIWTATVDINKTMTVTFTRGGRVGDYGGNVLQFRNARGIGASAKANVASGTPTLNLTTTQSNSAIVVANVDWTALSGASRTWRTNAGSFTERSYAAVSGAYTIYSGYHANAGLIGTYAVGLSAPAGQKYSIVAVEVR
jgi:plastocyanin